MLPGQKTTAESLRLGLAAGYRSVRDAVAWADHILAEDPAPDVEIMDVAIESGAGGRITRRGT
jgi:hypothetical protein